MAHFWPVLASVYTIAEKKKQDLIRNVWITKSEKYKNCVNIDELSIRLHESMILCLKIENRLKMSFSIFEMKVV